MKQFCIVIPVYKAELDCIEEISLKRLYTVIGKTNYQVYLVCPEKLNIQKYIEYYPGINVEYFDPKYFISTATYSQLCISYDFYKRFDNFEYMLIHQLDCYLFSDNIKEWCDKGYDYCGGPILSTDCGWDTVKKSRTGNEWHPYIGNGGFSLRKIAVFKDITDPNGELRTTYKILTDEYLSNVIFEDKYFCNDLYNIYYLSVPNWEECFNFALDMSVDIVYTILKFEGLPMGAHSIDKNIRWWKNVIPELSDKNVIDYCEQKHLEFFKLYYNENDSTLR